MTNLTNDQLDAAAKVILRDVLLINPDDLDVMREESCTERGYAPVFFSSWGGPSFQGGKADLRAIVLRVVEAVA